MGMTSNNLKQNSFVEHNLVAPINCFVFFWGGGGSTIFWGYIFQRLTFFHGKTVFGCQQICGINKFWWSTNVSELKKNIFLGAVKLF
jgi:hypothetical protein